MEVVNTRAPTPLEVLYAAVGMASLYPQTTEVVMVIKIARLNRMVLHVIECYTSIHTY